MPMFVHDRVLPGVPEMKRLATSIAYSVEVTPAGGRVLITTTNPGAARCRPPLPAVPDRGPPNRRPTRGAAFALNQRVDAKPAPGGQGYVATLQRRSPAF